MSVLTDVETSAEALQEDEELIEAVEQLVQTAAEIIYEDIRNDVDSIVHDADVFINTIFPFLKRWRETEGLFWLDMQKLTITIAVATVLYYLIYGRAKLKRNFKKHSSWMRRTYRTRRVSSFHGFMNHAFLTDHRHDADEHNARRTMRTHSEGEEHFNRFLPSGECFEDDEETEEEKFEKNWPSILNSGYKKLVLPPNCKLVARTQQQLLLLRINKLRDKESKKASNDSAKKKEIDDEDHPVNRLVNYMRHFAMLVVSFLKYDYMATGDFIMNWLQACIRRRQPQTQSSDNAGVDDDIDDDESDIVSLQTVSTRRDSKPSQSAPVSATTSATATVSGRASDASSAVQRSKAKQSEKASLNKDSPIPTVLQTTMDDENDTVDTRANRSLDSLSLDGDYHFWSQEEEKKTGAFVDAYYHSAIVNETATTNASANTNMDTPAAPPGTHGTTTPPTTPTAEDQAPPSSIRSWYQTPSDEEGSQSSSAASLPAERATSRSAHLPRPKMPNLTKSKDALQSYRSGKPLKLKLVGHEVAEEPAPQIHSTSNGEYRDSSGYYFEPASSKQALRQMAVEVPVPDKNGYIIGDDFLPDPSWTPLLVFVNSRSGAQQGHLLLNQLKGLLNPIQVWDLANGGPETVLESFSCFTRLRIMVCGGDGTVSWVVSSIEGMNLPRWPPIAILPLGTGNDLARIHGWGGGYNNDSLIDILDQVNDSYVSWLDRWEVSIVNKKGKVKSVKSFFNYMGVGADAQNVLQVHMLRESKPQLFFSRLINKVWYGLFGAEEAIKATSINLPYDIQLFADGVEVPLPPDSQGIIMLNIDSYAGGMPLWATATKLHQPQQQQQKVDRRGQLKRSWSLGSIGKIPKRNSAFDRIDSFEDLRYLDLSEEERYHHVTSCERPSSCQDGLLDIVTVRGTFHLGQIRVGLSHANRLCQCREARIVMKRKNPVQIDGEPWRQDACTLHVHRKRDAAIMLHRSANENIGVETEMANLLDWAQEKSYINEDVHATMMKEFSRRIESKIRQRRVKSQDNIMGSLKRAIGSTNTFQQTKDKPVMF